MRFSLLAMAVLAVGCGSSSSGTCDAASCGGCCDSHGKCQVPTAEHCGLDGAMCTACQGAQACENGMCATPGSGAGGSSGSASGSAGGSTGGASTSSAGSSGATSSNGS